MGNITTIARRTFLVGATAIAGGVAFGYWKYKTLHANPLLKHLKDNAAALTPYVLITSDSVTIIAPRAEMGQGTHTTLAALVAEELNFTSLDQINVIHGPASKAYYNVAVLEEGLPFASTDTSSLANNVRDFMHVPGKFMAIQVTGGSSSIKDGFHKMRLAGAIARETLILAAAKKLNIAAKELQAKDGYIFSDSSRIAFTDLAAELAFVEIKQQPKLKPKRDWKLLGQSLPRVDMVAKSTGTALFSIDVELPNMLYATVKMNPHLDGEMISFDATQAENMTGVKKVFELDNGIAVVASNTWYAFKAAEAVVCNWGPSPHPKTTAAVFSTIAESFIDERLDHQSKDDGDVDLIFGNSKDSVVYGEYRAPYLAHATMEPMNATALLKDGKLQVWAGNQHPTLALKSSAEIAGLDESDVSINTTLMGGGFGRRLEVDFVKQAVKIAKRFPGTPIKTTWTREEDMTHDYYRPAAVGRFKAVMDEQKPKAVLLHMAAPSIMDSQMARSGLNIPGPDRSISQSSWDQPYDIENYRISAFKAPAVQPVSSWRSVGASQNAFFSESMMDELAHAKNLDPLTMRLNMMNDQTSKTVLQTVAKLSNWGKSLAEGRAMGVAFTLSFGVAVAEVVEVAIINDKIKVLKVFAVADVGTVLDPKNVEAQIFGGIIYGLSAAIKGEITINDGKVEQTNFHTYDGLRMRESPEIDIKILENGRSIRGIGEPGLPPIAPALSNAIYSVTGARIRELPLNKHIKFMV